MTERIRRRRLPREEKERLHTERAPESPLADDPDARPLAESFARLQQTLGESLRQSLAGGVTGPGFDLLYETAALVEAFAATGLPKNKKHRVGLLLTTLFDEIAAPGATDHATRTKLVRDLTAATRADEALSRAWLAASPRVRHTLGLD